MVARGLEGGSKEDVGGEVGGGAGEGSSKTVLCNISVVETQRCSMLIHPQFISYHKRITLTQYLRGCLVGEGMGGTMWELCTFCSVFQEFIFLRE